MDKIEKLIRKHNAVVKKRELLMKKKKSRSKRCDDQGKFEKNSSRE